MAPGDAVRVSGLVAEHRGGATGLSVTQLAEAAVAVMARGVPLPVYLADSVLAKVERPSAAVKLAAGGTRAELVTWRAQYFNNMVDATVTGVFLVLVTIVVIANARVWWQLLAGKRVPDLHEEPYVAATESAKA